jgi:hypothetical protein
LPKKLAGIGLAGNEEAIMADFDLPHQIDSKGIGGACLDW